MPEQQNIRDQKLTQYLVEAHGKEQQLETALQAHIAMTTHKPYRRRLQQHLSETKRHARDVERRVKQLGGKVDAGLGVGVENAVEAVETVQTLAKKGAALAQGPMHMIRGTGEAEKQLKNAKTEFANEAEEIATYKAIEALATAVGDKETAKLARTIRRDEEKMSSFLERQIETLTKQVAREEIPAAERNGASRSRRSPARKAASSSKSSASSRKSTTARRKPAARKRSTTSAASRSRSTSSTKKRSSTSSTKKRSGSSTSARSTRKRSSSSPSRNGASASRSSSRSRSSSTTSGRKKTAARS